MAHINHGDILGKTFPQLLEAMPDGGQSAYSSRAGLQQQWDEAEGFPRLIYLTCDYQPERADFRQQVFVRGIQFESEEDVVR